MDELTLPFDILRFDYKERLRDRFLTTHIHRFEMFSKPVALIVLVEIINPWHPSSELGQKIINSLVREFLRSDNQSFLTRFETSLKRVNPAVQEALDQTKSPVSCTAVLLEVDQIHSSGIGSAKLGLLRHGKLATILGGAANQTELFSAVTSGDMRENDWLIIANSSFYSALSQLDDQIWLNEDTARVGEAISAERFDQKSEKFVGIILRFNSARPTTNQSVFWDQSKSISSNRTILKVPKLNFAAINPTFGKFRRLLVGLLDQIKTLRLPNRSGSLADNERKPISTMQWRRFVPIGIFVIILLGGIWFGYDRYTTGQANQKTETTTLFDELKNLPSNLLLASLNEKFTPERWQALSDSEQADLATLLSTQKIILTDLPAAVTDSPSPIMAVALIENQPLIIDDTGQNWQFNGSLLNKLSQKVPIANPISLTALSATNIVITDTTGNFWRLDGSTDQPIALTQSSAIASGGKLVENYQGNLYFINTATRVTYRVSSFSGDLSKATQYNKAENLVGVTTPTDLAVNGKVIVADSSGLVVEFARNGAASTQFQAPIVDGPTKVATRDGADLTLISSGRIIYFIDASNQLKGQIFLATNAKINDIILDSSDPTKFWLTSGNQLFKLTVPIFP